MWIAGVSGMNKTVLRAAFVLISISMYDGQALFKRKPSDGQLAKQSISTLERPVRNLKNECANVSKFMGEQFRNIYSQNLEEREDTVFLLLCHTFFSVLNIFGEVMYDNISNIIKSINLYNKGESMSNKNSEKAQEQGSSKMDSAKATLAKSLSFIGGNDLRAMDAMIKANFSFILQVIRSGVGGTNYAKQGQKKTLGIRRSVDIPKEITKIAAQLGEVSGALNQCQGTLQKVRDEISESEDSFNNQDFETLLHNLEFYRDCLAKLESHIGGMEMSEMTLNDLMEKCRLSGNPDNMYGYMGMNGMNNGMGMNGMNNGMGMNGMNNGMGMNGMNNGMGMNDMNDDMGMNGMNSNMGMNGMNNGMGMNGMNNGMGMNGMNNGMGMNGMSNGMGMNGMSNGMGMNGMSNGMGMNGMNNGMGMNGMSNGMGMNNGYDDDFDQNFGNSSYGNGYNSFNQNSSFGNGNMNMRGMNNMSAMSRNMAY